MRPITSSEAFSGDLENYLASIYCQDFIDYQYEIFKSKCIIEMNLDYLKYFDDEETLKQYELEFKNILYRIFTPKEIETIIYYDDNL